LSLVEHALVACVRLYHGTIKLGAQGVKTGPGAVPKVIKGNMICFLHSGPQVVAKVVPDMDKVEDSFVFSFVGPKGESDRVMKAAMQSERLRARASVVFWCVRVLKILNPRWSDVELPRTEETARRVSALATNFQNHAVIADDEVYQVADQIVSDDTARVRSEDSSEEECAAAGDVQVVLDGILLTDKTGGGRAVNSQSPESAVLQAVAAAASGQQGTGDDTEDGSLDGEHNEQEQHAGGSANPPPQPFIKCLGKANLSTSFPTTTRLGVVRSLHFFCLEKGCHKRATARQTMFTT